MRYHSFLLILLRGQFDNCWVLRVMFAAFAKINKGCISMARFVVYLFI